MGMTGPGPINAATLQQALASVAQSTGSIVYYLLFVVIIIVGIIFLSNIG